MWISVILTALRWIVSSGVVSRVLELVEQAETMDMAGADKWHWVWSQLRQDAKMMGFVHEKGRYLINLAIEAAVARLRK